jgi:hypothetical protein
LPEAYDSNSDGKGTRSTETRGVRRLDGGYSFMTNAGREEDQEDRAVQQALNW